MIEKTYMVFFKTLCNETRLNIILCLEKSPKHVSQIIKETNMEQSRVSHNLQCLVKNGFVTVEQKGKQRVYTLNKDTVVPILRDTKKHTQKYNLNVC